MRHHTSLFAKIRSPSMMVGIIDPVGTMYQSAMADLNAVAISKAIRTLPIHPRINTDMYCLKDLFIFSSNLA
jgi:hypothetical protein